MAVFRVPKHNNFTVMSNHHLRNKDISLKAKGLMSLMLSLPENWDYSQAGLAMICKDGVDSIRSAVNELEGSGYLKRRRIRSENGRFTQTEYTIQEEPEKAQSGRIPPILEKPILENPTQGKPIQEKTTQLNKDKLNTKELNTNQSIEGRSAEMEEKEIRNQPERLDAESEKARRKAYESVIKSNIDYDTLVFDRPYEKGRIDELILIILDFLFYKKEYVVIGELEIPTEIVRKRLFLLNQSHILYVLEQVSKNRAEIRNIRKYLLSALYYAPSSMDNYYMAKVGHDNP